jgi:hypothetical protein
MERTEPVIYEDASEIIKITEQKQNKAKKNEIDIADECNDKISNCVDNYFSCEFSLTDHCDIDDIVADKVDDRLEEMVNEKLQEMLSTATITFNN